MTSREFCYWLQGWFELNDSIKNLQGNADHHTLNVIQKHLAMVFKHEIDPSYPNQDQLNEIHTPQKLECSNISEQLADFKPLLRC